MSVIKIDGKDYEFETLSDEIKGNLISMQFCDNELQRLQATAAALQTARVAYARTVSEKLNEVDNPLASFQGDSIQFA
jgi:hypothetical protein